MSVLIVYATSEGQTEKIARFLAVEFRKKMERVDVFNAQDIPPGVRPDFYDGVVLGASVHGGKFQEALRSWVELHATSLNAKPSAFFSVCLGILQNDQKVQDEERKIVTRFLEDTGWNPRMWAIFPGSLAYSRYGWLKKTIMKRIARQAGGSTDTTKDHEYTDWPKVAAFAQEFVAIVRALAS